MCLGDGQVQHQFDRIVAEQLVDGADLGHAELLGLCPRTIHLQVRARRHLHDREVLRHPEVRAADRAAADHAHSNRFDHDNVPCVTVNLLRVARGR